jgi:hypothetical protein
MASATVSDPEKSIRAVRRLTLPMKMLLISFLALLIPVIWFSVFHTTETPNDACNAQYDELVKQAKTELTNGDRRGALNSLIAARNKLRDCQAFNAKDVDPLAAP